MVDYPPNIIRKNTMLNMNEALSILSTEEYQAILNTLTDNFNLKIYEGDIHQLLDIDEKRMGIANFHFNDAMKILTSDSCRLMKFLELKLKLVDKINNEENKFNPILEHHGYGKDFLLMYMIEYFLLNKNDDSLLTYIKAIRIPNAKKYIKELEGILNLMKHADNKQQTD